MVYPAETNPSVTPRLQRERNRAKTAACRSELSAFPVIRALSRSASERKTGNANAYIGTWQFVIQENLAAFAVGNDCAKEMRKAV